MHRLTPKLLLCLREGYTRKKFTGDVVAGLSVAIIALPLAMAFGIASIPQGIIDAQAAAGAPISPPAMGLITSIVAGIALGVYGGSRVQVSGASGISIVIISSIAARDGYAGLLMATAMAGVILIIMGICRFGAIIKFIPYPVVAGFTAGSAVIIATSQLREFFGVTHGPVEPDVMSRLWALAGNMHTLEWSTLGVGVGALAVLMLVRRFAPRVPGPLVAIVLAAGVNFVFGLGAETIGERFGGIPRVLPTPSLPSLGDDPWGLFKDLIPDATTIAMIVAIEALLSAVVGDGMTGRRHQSDAELVGQGVANIGSVLFGGLPVTGGASRTVANVKAGGQTPISSIVHAAGLMGVMVLGAPLAAHIPLAALAAILFMVAWSMANVGQFRSLLRAPSSDVAVLLTTFGITVFVSFTVAVGVGLVLASLLFMRRMAEVSNVSAITKELREGGADDDLAALKDPGAVSKRDVPAGVEVYEINGPFFFGVADRLGDILREMERPPRVFILRMRKVPAIDASGLYALEEFHKRCRRNGTRLLLSGVHAQPLMAFTRTGFDEVVGVENMFESFDEALAAARGLLGLGVGGVGSSAGSGSGGVAAGVGTP